MIMANSPLGPAYQQLLAHDLTLGIAPLALTKSVLHWINDGLMAMFFLLIGIEIKRECLWVNSRAWSRAALPAIGALGGMLVPALVYLAFNHAHVETRAGWPIPTATDIAFALGVLALAGLACAGITAHFPAGARRHRRSGRHRADRGAVHHGLSWQAMVLGAALPGVAAAAQSRCRYSVACPTWLVGFLLWLSVLKSGVHATLAGVVLGLVMPLPRARGTRRGGALRACAASVGDVRDPAAVRAGECRRAAARAWAWRVLLHPVTLGIAVGLLAGKLAGVFGFTWLAVRLGVCRLPAGDLATPVRSRDAHRHRLHDEPVPRRAGLHRRSITRRDPARAYWRARPVRRSPACCGSRWGQGPIPHRASRPRLPR